MNAYITIVVRVLKLAVSHRGKTTLRHDYTEPSRDIGTVLLLHMLALPCLALPCLALPCLAFA